MSGLLVTRVCGWLLASAEAQAGPRHADWARAMAAEADACGSCGKRVGWAWGCWVAGVRLGLRAEGTGYFIALAGGVALMAATEWRMDESTGTVLVLGGIALALGALRPRQAIQSGVLVGVVVTGVIGFEASSGLRPAYEAVAQTWVQGLAWLILLVPAVGSAIAGARIRQALHNPGSHA